MPASSKRVTAADVARALGLSRATVGFVLNNTPGQTIPEKTRQRVLAEAERLGYRPNHAAQALRRGNTRLVMLLMPDWPVETSLAGFLDEVSFRLDQAGYTLVTYTRRAGDRARPLWETLHPDVVLGLGELDEVSVRSAKVSGAKVVLTQSIADSALTAAGARLQVRHLYERGHRRLAFALPEDRRLAELAATRCEAARRAAAELGLPPLDVRSLAAGDDTAARAVRQWRDAGITGVLAYNDFIAALAVGAAVRAGIGVPTSLAVIGHDDAPFGQAFVPALSSVRMGIGELARYVADLALHGLGHTGTAPAPLVPDFRIVHRESS
ncbi:LacI family DNA-binding transcriptional regulator [Nocardia sp. NPDC050697]|uniref:LacI family DNA-binding transcriptional regulator n=1 Tax=Nocardia sp. NPDC050697 TaxID=3155158 RepID=UPI0033F21651